jgi:hypothetical protein
MADDIVSKIAVSVSEMARMVGLSRARFYQLVRGGTFPPPDHEATTGRPYYSQERQRACLEVRRRNCGIDGKTILFYTRRRDAGVKKMKPENTKPGSPTKEVVELLHGLKALGLTTATAAQIEELVRQLYPTGTADIDQGQVLKAVFLELRHRNSGDSAG